MEKRSRLYCPVCEIVVQLDYAHEGDVCGNCREDRLVLVAILVPGQPPAYATEKREV